MNAKAIELLLAAIIVAGEAMNTVTRINDVLNRARDEGREISDDELNALAAQTDDEHRKTIDVLDGIIKNVS